MNVTLKMGIGVDEQSGLLWAFLIVVDALGEDGLKYFSLYVIPSCYFYYKIDNNQHKRQAVRFPVRRNWLYDCSVCCIPFNTMRSNKTTMVHSKPTKPKGWMGETLFSTKAVPPSPRLLRAFFSTMSEWRRLVMESELLGTLTLTKITIVTYSTKTAVNAFKCWQHLNSSTILSSFFETCSMPNTGKWKANLKMRIIRFTATNEHLG